MLMWIEAVQQLLLLLDFTAYDSEVEHLDEMRYIHTCVLHDMAVLLVGIDGGCIVVFRLHDRVLKCHKEPLRFTQHFVRKHLLGEIRSLRPLDSVL